MIISLNWLKKFVDIDMPVDELATLIGSRLVEIEKVEYLGDKYKDALLVRVVEAGKLEGSDHLSLTKIDDGGVAKNVERDVDGFIQVVCGAPNIKTGQLVVWLPPESIVPETYAKPDEFKLGVRNLLGVTSNGMIASAKELGISDDHEGILVIDEADGFMPGITFCSAYELDDFLLHIENKSLTHRPDCFGVVGFAREVSAIVGKEFKTSEWLMDSSTDFGLNDSEIKLNVTIDDSEICDRYLAIVLSDADSKKKSPLLIQTYLSRVDVRPINSVVDVTNYLMMTTGQPLHAFDYDKLISLNDNKAEIIVRLANENEELELLDGKKIKLSISDIVISSGKVVVGLAGAMGGANTAIDDSTKRIIIESATFNLYNLRSTQMRHGIFSEAITRFTKGQPAELSAPVLKKAAKFTMEWAGANIISAVAESYPGKKDVTKIEVCAIEVNKTLGVDIEESKMINLLKFAEFGVELKDGTMFVSAPYWRKDIHIKEDIIEEVGRLNGFDNISPDLPIRDFTATAPSAFDIFRTKIRKILVRFGSNEVLNYSFVHGNILQKVDQKIDNSYQLVNSISPDLQYYRQSLTPSLLNIVNQNIRQGFDSFSIFEINKVHQKHLGLTDENVPIELNNLSFVYTNKSVEVGASYYKSKQILDNLAKLLKIELEYRNLNDETENVSSLPFELRRSAAIFTQSGENIGVVGEYKKSVTRSFKLPEYSSGFEIDLDKLFMVVNEKNNSYQPLSRYPTTERDICFQVDKKIVYQQIITPLKKAAEKEDFNIEFFPVDIYEKEELNTKNITIKIKLMSYDHTPDGKEISSVVDNIIDEVKSTIEVTIV